MSEFVSKIEDFLFDILGLIIPGLIFLFVIVSPIYLFDIDSVDPNTLSNSASLEAICIFNNKSDDILPLSNSTVIIILLIVSYIIGHIIKVASILKYEILTAVFDKNINKLSARLFEILIQLFKSIIVRVFKRPELQRKIFRHLQDFTFPFIMLFDKVFVFNPANYNRINEPLKFQATEIINRKLSTTFPNEWYSLYVFSKTIHNQEGLKSLTSNYLAKYNLYRSLALIFLFSSLYFFFLIRINEEYIFSYFKKSANYIPIIFTVLWFTFHYKYKRYWTLFGNESLVSLYFYLNKKNLNEV